MDSAAVRTGYRQFDFSGVEQNLESDISHSVAYLVKRGGPVNLRVKISKEWQRDPKKLDKLGY